MNVGTVSAGADVRRPCPKCSYKNRLGILFCEECGTPINTSVRSVTVANDVPDELKQKLAGMSKVVPNMDGRLTEGGIEGNIANTPSPDVMTHAFEKKERSCLFSKGTTLMLEVDGLVTPILVELPQDKPVVIGRKDDNYTPQIDLLAYGAQKHGMSRRHAALKLRRKRLDIVDLDSSNGTFINDDKLDSGEPNQLRDGDVLRLGRLKITVRFYQA